MFYAIAYPVQTHAGAIDHNVVLSDLSADALADVFQFLANGNAHGEWFVPEATVYSMAGEYVGNPSFRSFEPQAKAFRNGWVQV